MKKHYNTVRVKSQSGTEGVYVKALAQLEYIRGNIGPHFSLTASVIDTVLRDSGDWGYAPYSSWSYGCQHEEIIKTWGYQMVPGSLVKWHLCNLLGGPMHYIANGVYWAGFGQYAQRDRDTFNTTVACGALPEDAIADPFEFGEQALVSWLIGRFTRLMLAFDADMLAVFGPDYDDYKRGWFARGQRAPYIPSKYR